jgi:trk system potassium uptake protein TrkH
MTVSRTICLGFLLVIAVGTLLLLTPVATSDGHWNGFVTALFTSTSAVCVTGLIVVDTGSYYSFFGELIILLLIQVGGLGYMTANTFLLLLLGLRFGLREKLAIQQSLDTPGISGVLQLVRSIIAVTLICELTGVLVLLPVFSQDYGLPYGLWLALFHSVSAFNNAGFSLFPDSLSQYATSLPMNLVIPVLIIIGGIGYQVMMESFMWVRDRFLNRRTRSVFSLNFKIVTSTTLVLLVLGTITMLATEFSNPETLGSLNLGQKLMVAWFQGVTPRTAGFNSIDYGHMTNAALFLTIMLMFVGASPGSTGGGIKTTTLRVLFNSTKAVLQGKEEVLCYQREIPVTLVLKAVGVVFGSGVSVLCVTTLIVLTNPGMDFIDILFESVSAFATVGLSTGITASLTIPGKVVLIPTMYAGRVGILILMAALLGDPRPSSVNYPEENLLVG